MQKSRQTRKPSVPPRFDEHWRRIEFFLRHLTKPRQHRLALRHCLSAIGR